MESQTIEREIYIDASPTAVFKVVSDPEHMKRWWPADACYDAIVGGTGGTVFGDADGGGTVVALSIVEIDPPTTFSFRWTYGADETAGPGNSRLVTFGLSPQGEGTLLKCRETSSQATGWPTDTIQEQYDDHANGWDDFLPPVGLVRRRSGCHLVNQALLDDRLWSAIGDPTRHRCSTCC